MAKNDFEDMIKSLEMGEISLYYVGETNVIIGSL